MTLIPLSSIGTSRPRSYLVRDGQIVLVDEGVRDFVKSLAKRAVSAGTKAIRKVLGKSKPKEAEKKEPEPEKKPAPAPTSKVDRAEASVADAKKKASAKVKDAAATASAGKESAASAKKRRASIKAANEVRAKKKAAAKAAADMSGDKRASTIKSTEKTSGKMSKVNAQLAHCILALHHKRGKDVRGAWNICRASLTKTGYMKGPYNEKGKVADLRPTQKGVRRAMQHAMEKRPLGGGIEGSPQEKYAKFSKLFKQIELSV